MVLCFFKQNTAYEMRISDWSSDVCSSDLPPGPAGLAHVREFLQSVGGAGARHRAGDWLAESADRDTSGRSECGASARSRRDRETTIAVTASGRRPLGFCSVLLCDRSDRLPVARISLARDIRCPSCPGGSGDSGYCAGPVVPDQAAAPIALTSPERRPLLLPPLHPSSPLTSPGNRGAGVMACEII